MILSLLKKKIKLAADPRLLAMKAMVIGWYWPADGMRCDRLERELLMNVKGLKYENVPVSIADTETHMHCAYSLNERANGDPVVFAHGLGAGLAFFYKNIQPLIDAGRSVYLFDWLGMGRSGRPAFPHYPQNSVATIIDFFTSSFDQWMERMGLQRVVLIGHSLGGYLSALYALAHPEKISKLILLSPVGLPLNAVDVKDRITAVTGHEVPSWLVFLWNNNYTPQSIVRALGPIGPRLARSYVNRRFSFLPEPERSSLGDYLYEISADVGSGEYALAGILMPGAWAREPLHDRLPDLQMPCHFMYGEEDWMDWRHAEEAMKKMSCERSVVCIPRSGHHLYIDNPDEFNRVLSRLILS